MANHSHHKHVYHLIHTTTVSATPSGRHIWLLKCTEIFVTEHATPIPPHPLALAGIDSDKCWASGRRERARTREGGVQGRGHEAKGVASLLEWPVRGPGRSEPLVWVGGRSGSGPLGRLGRGSEWLI